jgi:hypothetical protein
MRGEQRSRVMPGGIVMRRVAVSLIAASLIGAVLASPIVAETVQRDRSDFDRVLGSFAFVEGGRDFTGQIAIDRDNETGESMAIFFFGSRGPEQTCDNGTPEDPSDDFVAGDSIDFTVQSVPATLSIESNLSAASASATVAGERIESEACSGNQTATPETVTWQIALEATGPATRTTEVERFPPNEDGTVETLSIKTAQRPAAGSISIGDAAQDMVLDVIDASITNFRIVVTTH